MIEITESKAEKLSENIEKSLKYMGKAMQCVESLMEESGMGQRGGSYGSRYGERGGQGGGYGSRYGERGGYSERGGSMGYRDEDDEDEWESMNERRGVRGSGRGRR